MKTILRVQMLCVVVLLLMAKVVAQPLQLSDAVNIALQNNERLKQYEERYKQKGFQNLEAWGNFLPTVSLQGSYNHMNKNLVIDLNPIRTALVQLQASDQVQLANLSSLLTTGSQLNPAQQAAVFTAASTALDAKLPPFEEKFKDRTYTNASVIAVQPLFVGGKLLAAKYYASSELNASEIEYEAIHDEVIQQTIISYLAVVLLQDVVRIRTAVLDATERHRKQAYRLMEEGLIAHHQALRADVAVAEAERQLLDEQNRYALALISLRHTLGLPDYEPLEIRDSLLFMAVPDSLDYFVSQADAEHPILRSLQEKKKAARAGYYSELSEFLPHAAVFGKYELYPQYLSLLEPRWIVGIQVSMNIFSGMKKYARTERAVHQEREVEYLEADAHRKVNLFIHKRYADIQNAINRYEKLQRTLVLARENLRLMTNRFATGMASSLDVIDAQLIVEKNEVESKESLYQYYTALTDLYTAIGNPQKMITLWTKEK